MGYPNNKDNKRFVFNKGSYKSQCAYMLMLIRQKNPQAWLKFKQEFGNVSDEDTFEFYEKLVAFYKGKEVISNVVALTPTKPIVKNKEIKREADKKEEVIENKSAVKQPKKKVAKKAVKKKVEKKQVKKTAKKKVAKKVVKEKVAKKPIKKKVAKKKTVKK